VSQALMPVWSHLPVFFPVRRLLASLSPVFSSALKVLSRDFRRPALLPVHSDLPHCRV
jgi:hypothetical protein